MRLLKQIFSYSLTLLVILFGTFSIFAPALSAVTPNTPKKNCCGCTAANSNNANSTKAQAVSDTSSSLKKKQPAFKGMELYSWREEKDIWCFRLMHGTNRHKFFSEIQNREKTLHGLDELQKRFGELAEMEYVSWTHDNVYGKPLYFLEYPPIEIRQKIIQFAAKRKIRLFLPEKIEEPVPFDPSHTDPWALYSFQNAKDEWRFKLEQHLVNAPVDLYENYEAGSMSLKELQEKLSDCAPYKIEWQNSSELPGILEKNPHLKFGFPPDEIIDDIKKRVESHSEFHSLSIERP